MQLRNNTNEEMFGLSKIHKEEDWKDKTNHSYSAHGAFAHYVSPTEH